MADQIDALLPQTQCGQCGYPGCRPYAEAIAKGEADINQCAPGGEAGIIALSDLLGRDPEPLIPNMACTNRRCSRSSTKVLHRLHAVHPGLPGGCDPRCLEADAHRDRRRVHRLRIVRSTLSGELHRNGPRRTGPQQLEMADRRHERLEIIDGHTDMNNTSRHLAPLPWRPASARPQKLDRAASAVDRPCRSPHRATGLAAVQHIGVAGGGAGKLGERVLKGQLIARRRQQYQRAGARLKFRHRQRHRTRAVPHPSGLPVPCIVIATDGLDEWITPSPGSSDPCRLTR